MGGMLHVCQVVANINRDIGGPAVTVPRLCEALTKESRKANIVHNHGLWMFPNFYARQAAITSRIPLVISPRGMLEDWSLGRSRIKKFMAWSLFERGNLRSAALFHATSEMEARSMRELGL